MFNTLNIGNSEILLIADAVAREKGITKDSVIEAMEQAVQVAGRRKYGHEHVVRAEIDKKTGEIKLFRELEVVAEVEDTFKQISLADALQKEAAIEIGGKILDPLPPIDLGRVAAQTAKQVIVQKIRDAEKEREYNDFKDRIAEIANGIVKRIEYGNVTLDLGRAEAILEKRHMLPNESYRQNDRVRAYVLDVRRDNKGPQIYLSRTCNEFIAKLFAQEVPEVYEKIIEIKSVAREPGSRAKMAVYARDSSIDPVGSCVGVRGSRVQAVSNELQGEKIDIIQWSQDPANYVVNALAPAEISKVVIDEAKNTIEVVVPADQLSAAIGRRGQNVRLASQLTGWSIDVLTEDEESKRRLEEFSDMSQLFIKALDVEEVLAQLLAAEGFTSVEDIAYVNVADLAAIEGFDENLAQELQKRANDYLGSIAPKAKDNTYGLAADLISLLGLSSELLAKIAQAKVLSLADLADLSTDELQDILAGENIDTEVLAKLIMKARNKIALQD
jgi:transcription termination/antitermination protein NusA